MVNQASIKSDGRAGVIIFAMRFAKLGALVNFYPKLNSEVWHICSTRIFIECNAARPNGEKH